MKILFNKIYKKKNFLLLALVFYSIYCAINIGKTWDEGFHLNQGKVILNYLLSFGQIDEKILYRENYSTFYWSFSYLITKIFPAQFSIQVSHLVNLFFSLLTIIGIGKLNKELFNKEVGQITFLILFFYPIFFGHMAFNSKDTILAFSHVWIFYYALKYFKSQSSNYKSLKYIIIIGLLSSLATGIQMVFLGSLVPILIFLILDVFIFKIFISKKFKIKKFIVDLGKCFLVFYSSLIFFWVDAYSNIFLFPINALIETFSSDYWTGWSYNLVNGSYYNSSNVPYTYLMTNFIFKTPEFILLLYSLFIIILFSKFNFYKKKFEKFKIKLLLIISLLIFPNLLLLIIPYPLYDGVRLFLWIVPYLSIIPALTLFYLIKNTNLLFVKGALSLLTVFIIFFLHNFIIITPYHYTYLNTLNSKKELRYQKFENDYWGASIKELVSETSFEKNKLILVATCGLNNAVLKHYMKNKYKNKFAIVDENKAEFIIMTNRAVKNDKPNLNPITNCFDKFDGKDIYTVNRNKLILSTIRKLN